MCTNKRKLALLALILIYLGTLFSYWFGHDTNVDGIKGLDYLDNFVMVIGLIVCIFGITKWARSSIFFMIGSITVLLAQVGYLILWHKDLIAMEFNFSLSAIHIGFYLSGIVASIMVISSIVLFRNERLA